MTTHAMVVTAAVVKVEARDRMARGDARNRS
jgi:hypothetical protein